jgi:uncharacterized protein (DUF433 family)
MNSVPTEKTHVEITPGVCGGRPRIVGTRVRVQDIVLRTEAGESPDEIVAGLPHLTLADVHGALTYYHGNRDAIDAQIAESDALARQIQVGTPPAPKSV